MTPDEQIEELRARLAAAQAELRGIRDDAGTPLAISDGLWKFAEEECGHNPLSARPALLTVIDWVQKAKVELADARLDTERLKLISNPLVTIVWVRRPYDQENSYFMIQDNRECPARTSRGKTLSAAIDAAREKEQKCQSKS